MFASLVAGPWIVSKKFVIFNAVLTQINNLLEMTRTLDGAKVEKGSTETAEAKSTSKSQSYYELSIGELPNLTVLTLR